MRLPKILTIAIALFSLWDNSIAQSVSPGWVSQGSGVTNFLEGVFFASVNTGTVVGGRGTILRTTNCGETWAKQISATTNDLYAVSFTDANTGTAVGDGGTILRTTNGGAEWVRQVSGTNTLLRAVSFINPNAGIAVGGTGVVGDSGTILRTTNGGMTWLRQVSDTIARFYSIYISDTITATVVGDGAILHTTDWGADWVGQASGASQSLVYVKFFHIDTGIVVGYEGHVFHSTNGGAAWIKQGIGLGEIFGAFFTDANTGIAVGTYVDSHDGIIFSTTNGGVNWERQFVLRNYYPRGVYFVNADTGFSIGDGGTILRTISGGRTTDVKNDPLPNSPSEFTLAQNYPNPFTLSTTISYYLPQSGDVILKLYTPLGTEVATLLHEREIAGAHAIMFTANTLPAGTYVVRAATAQSASMKKVFLLK